MKEVIDKESFDQLFDLYYEDLLGFVYSFVNDKEVSKDIVHDIFLNIWNNRKKINPSLAIKSYIFTLTRNHTFNYLKHKKVELSNEDEITYITKLSEFDIENYEERLQKVREKMNQLPEKQKQVVIKCVIEGKMYKEAAEEMNISINTVRTHLVRAMKFLRDELKEDIVLVLFLKSEKELR